MNKKYFYICLFISCLFVFGKGHAQEIVEKPLLENQTINLTVYPNPVSNGKIYIATKNNLEKEVDIFDVLGKKVISQTLFGKELNVSVLSPGVYILKVREQEFSATRKLVVR